MSQVMEIISKPGGGQTQFAVRKLHLLNQVFNLISLKALGLLYDL